jgi:hypothetical protein
VNVPGAPLIVPDRIPVEALKLRPVGHAPLLDQELELHPLFEKV